MLRNKQNANIGRKNITKDYYTLFDAKNDENFYNKSNNRLKPMDAFRRCLAKNVTDCCITLISFDNWL